MKKSTESIKKIKVELKVGDDELVTATCLSKPYKGNARTCDKEISKSLINLMSNFEETQWIIESISQRCL